jgi:hypothetical protein
MSTAIKMGVRLAMAALFTLSSTCALAHTQFNYDGIYARLKKSEKADFSHVTLAFSLRNSADGSACQVDAVRIVTDITDEPMGMAANGELTMPFSELLNNRKALIKIIQPANAAPCDLSMNIRSKIALESRLSMMQIMQLQRQFDGLLDSLAGLGKYFLPEVKGITLHFANEAQLMEAPAAIERLVSCQGTRCEIDLRHYASKYQVAKEDDVDAIMANKAQDALLAPLQLQFKQAPLQATPWIAAGD